MSSRSAKELLGAAQQEGVLSGASAQVLAVRDIGDEIQRALGTPADQVTSAEVVLVSTVVDDSGSIRFVAGNTEAVRDGHNGVLEALTKARRRDNVLTHTRLLNGGMVSAYCPLGQAVRLDQHNFNPTGGTPLYDQMVVFLGTVLAKSQELAEAGIPVRTVTLVITDGNDEHSRRNTASDVAHVVRDMLRQENHIIAAMGISDGRTNFQQVFGEMGIPDQWILTSANDPKGIRKAFALASESAVRASQTAASFSQTAVGGFGTP